MSSRDGYRADVTRNCCEQCRMMVPTCDVCKRKNSELVEKQKYILSLEKELMRSKKEAQKRLNFRGSVTKGVFCDGCADWEQMAWEAQNRINKAMEKIMNWYRTAELNGEVDGMKILFDIEQILKQNTKQ